MPIGTTPVSQMTVAQLRAEFQELAGEQALIADRRKLLSDELKSRLDYERMEQRIASLTPGQREAARQILCEGG